MSFWQTLFSSLQSPRMLLAWSCTPCVTKTGSVFRWWMVKKHVVEGQPGIDRSYRGVALLFLAIVGAFVFSSWQKLWCQHTNLHLFGKTLQLGESEGQGDHKSSEGNATKTGHDGDENWEEGRMESKERGFIAVVLTVIVVMVTADLITDARGVRLWHLLVKPPLHLLHSWNPSLLLRGTFRTQTISGWGASTLIATPGWGRELEVAIKEIRWGFKSDHWLPADELETHSIRKRSRFAA